MAKLALVVWTPDELEAGLLRERIEASGAFEILASPTDRASFVRAVAEQNPDAVVVSSQTGHDAAFEELLLEAGHGQPPRSLVVVPGDYSPSELDRARAKSLQTTSLSRSLLLRDDPQARDNITRRLRSLASRMTVRRRHTLEADDLMEAIDSVIEASQTQNMPAAVAELAAWPVDLVLLLGDPIALNDLKSLLKGLYDAVMPVIICVRGMSAEDLAEALSGGRGAEPKPLDRHGSLRELRGFFTAGWGEFALQGERFSSSPGCSPGSHPLVAAAGLGSALVSIELSRTNLDAEAHRRARQMGCVLATLHPDDCAEPEVARTLVERQEINTTFRLDELRWYLGHVVPRRA